MKIYTKSGDAGQTSLIFGRRVDKDTLRVHAYGTVDEANAVLGVAISCLPNEARFQDIQRVAERIQRDLFDVGRDLATPEDKQDGFYIHQADIQLLEHWIDQWDTELPTLTKFILPGGHLSAAYFQQARTVVRRAERLVVSVLKAERVQPLVRNYLNRLSDALFVMARVVNTRLGVAEPAVDFQADKPDPEQG